MSDPSVAPTADGGIGAAIGAIFGGGPTKHVGRLDKGERTAPQPSDTGFDKEPVSDGGPKDGLLSFPDGWLDWLKFMPREPSVMQGETVGQSQGTFRSSNADGITRYKVAEAISAYTSIEGAQRAADAWSLGNEGAQVAIVKTTEQASNGKPYDVFNVVRLDAKVSQPVDDDNGLDNIEFVEVRSKSPDDQVGIFGGRFASKAASIALATARAEKVPAELLEDIQGKDVGKAEAAKPKIVTHLEGALADAKADRVKLGTLAMYAPDWIKEQSSKINARIERLESAIEFFSAFEPAADAPEPNLPTRKIEVRVDPPPVKVPALPERYLPERPRAR